MQGEQETNIGRFGNSQGAVDNNSGDCVGNCLPHCGWMQPSEMFSLLCAVGRWRLQGLLIPDLAPFPEGVSDVCRKRPKATTELQISTVPFS